MKKKDNILTNPFLLYNIDVVGAKTGKVLTKFEKFLNFSVNAICAWSTYAVGCFFLLILVIILWHVVSAGWDYVAENPIWIIPIAIYVIVKFIFVRLKEMKEEGNALGKD